MRSSMVNQPSIPTALCERLERNRDDQRKRHVVDEEAKHDASAAGLLPTQGCEGTDDVNDEEKEDDGARVVMLFPTA